MKQRILLALDKNQFVLTNTAYGIHDVYKSLGGNSGNCVFQYALQKMLNDEDNFLALDFDLIHNVKKTKEYYDYINSNFDCVIFAASSILNTYAAKNILPYWIYNFEKIKIPVYVLSFGAATDKNDFEFGFLEEIKDISKTFIKTILKTEGKFALRGYFSKEAIEKLGFKNDDAFVVTGCPSIFLKGGNLNISNDKINYRNFRPVLNGHLLKNYKKGLLYFLKKERNSVFIDQDEFFDLIYFKKSKFNCLKTFIKRNYNPYIMTLLDNERLKAFINIQDWQNFLCGNNFNFCFGNRIHGSILSILNNIPSLVLPLDTRVKEMVSFFDIPYIEKIKTKNLYDLYLETDYSIFNQNFKKKYEIFEKFFKDIDIKIKIQQNEYENPDKSKDEKPSERSHERK